MIDENYWLLQISITKNITIKNSNITTTTSYNRAIYVILIQTTLPNYRFMLY